MKCLSLFCLVLCTIGLNARVMIGEERFKDIEELNLEQLLDVKIGIASGRAQPLDEAPGIVSAISAEEIRRLGARNLEDVLETVPGFEVLTDHLGRQRIVVRGLAAGASASVLVMFNGQRLNEAVTGGATALNLDIPVDNLERIEIIRGPGSALFGTNAFAGVINLIAYTAERFEGLRLSAGGGSFETRQFNVLAGKVLDGVGVSGFLQYMETDGAGRSIARDSHSPLPGDDDPFMIRVSRAPGETDDERRGLDANVHLTYKGLALSGRFKDERSGGYIGFNDNLSDSTLKNRQIVLDARYRYALGERGSVLAGFGFSQNESRQRLELLPPGGFFGTRFKDGIVLNADVNTRRFSGQVVLDYAGLAPHDFTLGISFANESTFDLQTQGNVERDPETLIFTPQPSIETLPFNLIRDSSRDVFSVFFQDIWQPWPQLNVTLGVRYDHFSDFGNTLDPRVAAVWRFAKPFYLKMLYGNAFRAPTFTELSFDATSRLTNFSGNAELKPATLQTFEAALGYAHPNLRLSANYFLTLVRDMIVLTPSELTDVDRAFSTYMNDMDIDIHGVEVEGRATWRDHTLFLNYTYQSPKIKETGERLPDVPSHLANLGVSMAIGPYVRLTPTLRIRSRRPRAEGDSRDKSPAYALVNVTFFVHHFFRTLELSGSVYNVFNTLYSDPAPISTVPEDYPRPGRSVFIKATYQF